MPGCAARLHRWTLPSKRTRRARAGPELVNSINTYSCDLSKISSTLCVLERYDGLPRRRDAQRVLARQVGLDLRQRL